MAIGRQPAPVDVTAHLPLLLIGLRWLLDTEQPHGALICPHDQSLPSVGNRRLRFRPQGLGGHPAVLIEITDADWDFRRSRTPNVVSPSELDDLLFVMSDCGEPAAATWQDNPRVTAAVALAAPAHPSLLAAVMRYRQSHPPYRGEAECHCSPGHCEGSQGAISVHDVHRAALIGGPSKPGGLTPELMSEAFDRTTAPCSHAKSPRLRRIPGQPRTYRRVTCHARFPSQGTPDE
ncbi:hypothetical protein [Mycobacterium pseudokansasii]|uniref:hypothetical protein n=1 Tax=Mycobacterium pseudokansasii TaxID=2341080 RepID=UPI000F0387A5|nr:hypothetical protein [Mycobacterium pseudokansasii]VBA34334.1 hypothetical protein LAUMK35_05708 [Mycobacterium pseudokansasii]VBA35826.1 hypothetical protein LAUMK21_05699 [Mycobacterium pseudokansasii]